MYGTCSFDTKHTGVVETGLLRFADLRDVSWARPANATVIPALVQVRLWLIYSTLIQREKLIFKILPKRFEALVYTDIIS